MQREMLKELGILTFTETPIGAKGFVNLKEYKAEIFTEPKKSYNTNLFFISGFNFKTVNQLENEKLELICERKEICAAHISSVKQNNIRFKSFDLEESGIYFACENKSGLEEYSKKLFFYKNNNFIIKFTEENLENIISKIYPQKYLEIKNTAIRNLEAKKFKQFFLSKIYAK